MKNNDPLISAENITIKYGAVTAVNDLNLQVNPGEVVGLLGGNGAGKSSTLRAFAGVNPSTSGRLHIAGYNMSDPQQCELARGVLGYCPDVGGLVRQATVREHIGIALGSRNRLHEWPYAMKLLEEFGLTDVLDRETFGFSHGMSRRLSVLLAALTSSKVLILDEPFDGVDPSGVHATERTIAKAKEAGLAIVVSTHLLSLLVGVSDKIAVMLHGQVVEVNPAEVYSGVSGADRYEGLLSLTKNARVGAEKTLGEGDTEDEVKPIVTAEKKNLFSGLWK